MMENDAPRYRPRDLFGPLVAGRDCGECTACCTYTNIDTPELHKPMGETCRHCTATGCGIYASRFPVCRAWHCLWRHVAEMPADARPDQTGLMFVLDRPDQPRNVLTKLYVRVIVTDAAKAEQNELSTPLLDMFAEGDLPVWLDDLSGELTLLHPSSAVADILINGTAPIDDAQAHRARTWRSGARSNPR